MLTAVMEKSAEAPDTPIRTPKPMKRKGKGTGNGKGEGASKGTSMASTGKKGKGTNKGTGKGKGTSESLSKGMRKGKGKKTKGASKSTAKAKARPQRLDGRTSTAIASPLMDASSLGIPGGPTEGPEAPPITKVERPCTSEGGGGKNDYWRPETDELRKQRRGNGCGCSNCRRKGHCTTCKELHGEASAQPT
ncbi:unnamed protein product [Prorocentrum cordatum]|uniref:CXXC-type domain-containing protein n=1 Tax=Prorocentrum cordatum TaxID=2364126 RepID=A0ABN9SSS0_9DINO|nr:unnamed protein product [Polarella glacialis]